MMGHMDAPVGQPFHFHNSFFLSLFSLKKTIIDLIIFKSSVVALRSYGCFSKSNTSQAICTDFAKIKSVICKHLQIRQ